MLAINYLRITYNNEICYQKLFDSNYNPYPCNGIFYINNLPIKKELSKLKQSYQENLKLLEELQSKNPNIDDEYRIKYLLEDLQEKKLKTGKFILKKEDPIFTYKYFLDICDKFGANLDFDFFISAKSDSESNFNSYTISGIAKIQDIYTFLYHLERQYLLYLITGVELREESTENQTIKYEIKIEAYQADTGTVEAETPWRELPPRQLDYNIFKSRIHGPIESQYEEQFINIETAKVIGLSTDKAFLSDGSGTIYVLIPGDKVAYGYVDSINTEEQYVQFRINKIGVVTTHKLYLKKE